MTSEVLFVLSEDWTRMWRFEMWANFVFGFLHLIQRRKAWSGGTFRFQDFDEIN